MGNHPFYFMKGNKNMANLFTPNSMIKLCQVPLENDYKHQLKFQNLTEQENYFNSRVLHTFLNVSYIRSENAIKVDGSIDLYLNINYCFYLNANYGSKLFFAFVIRVEYVSENVTKLYLETDVFQTYQFDLVYNQSFVEREHTNNDIAGFNTIPEGLELGEYIIRERYKDSTLNDVTVVMASTITPFEYANYYGGVYNGIYSGVRYYAFKQNLEESLRNILNGMAGAGKIDAVTGLFYAPDFLCGNQGGVILDSDTVQSYDITLDKISDCGGYVPKNNKLLTYPYIALMVSNANGGNAIYHQEEFFEFDDEIVFKVIGALTVGCSIRIYPYDYKGLGDNIDEGLNLGKFPSCNWATDQFTNWMTQNSVNVATSLIGSGIQIAGGVAMAGSGATALAGAGAIAGGISGIANTLNEVHRASIVPPQASGNLNAGDVIMASGSNTFHIYKMTIKSEHAKIIDEFFNLFGYKTNRVKVPNITGRSLYNYVKTIDCNIDGNIPQEYLNTIRSIFNQGVTLWHQADQMYRYDLSNDIID